MRLSNDTAAPLPITIYAILLTLFTTAMVGMSVLSPENFFTAYGITGDAAFHYSWSGRYGVVLILMIYGLALRSAQGVFITVLARFFIDLADVFGVFIYNTPAFSWENMAFLTFGLLVPQLVCMTLLWRGYRHAPAS